MKRLFRYALAGVTMLLLASIDVAAATVSGSPQPVSHSPWWLPVGGGALGLTLGSGSPTMLDLVSRLDPDDKIARIVEILNETNEVLDDMVMVECNKLTSHETTVRTGIPGPTWRKLYGYVQPSKSTTVKITDDCGMLENYSKIDVALADLNNQAPAFMLSESKPILEGFNQELAESLFYANETTEPEAFTGFGPRYNSTAAENGANIIDASGAGADNCSIWLIVWGPDTIHGIYPKGSKVGIQMNHKGRITDSDGAGGHAEMYLTHFRWDFGLCVRDWRYAVRIANIDNDALTKDYSAGADLVDLMTVALETVHSLTGGRPAFYMNRKCRAYLRRQMVNKKAASTITLDTVAGKKVLFFDEVPVRKVDALGIAEAHVA